MTHSNFVPTATWNEWINHDAKSLYDMLVKADPDYFTVSVGISTNGTDQVYGLPSDFFKVRGVDYTLSGQATAMRRYDWNERNAYSQSTGEVVRYRLVAGNIHFEPVPSAQDMTLWYVPALETLDDEDDTFDGINGWESLVEMLAARRALALEESDTSAIDAEIQMVMKRIEGLAPTRDVGEPERIQDVTGGSGHDPYSMGEF